MDAVDGMRVSLGPMKVLSYVVQVSRYSSLITLLMQSCSYIQISNIVLFVQGLFHPARKVRDVYWKIFNTLYIGSQDALVAGFPRIPNDAKNTYSRYQLDYVL